MHKPKKWHQVYPTGTPQGDKESKFFRALSRSSFNYVSTMQIATASGLSREDVEVIIEKYATQIDPPLIYAHEENDDTWCYWERDPSVIKPKKKSISATDMDNRIRRHFKEKQS